MHSLGVGPYPLPPVACPHNSFWYWGYGDTTRNIIIAIGWSQDDYLRTFSSVVEVGTIHSEYAIPVDNNLEIFVCRGLKEPIGALWSRLKFLI